MRLSITSDGRYLRTPDGAVWSDGALHYGVWSRYLDVFDCVNVVARVAPIDKPHDKLRRADGLGVEFSDVPTYVGVWQYLKQARAVKRAARAGIRSDDAVMLNVPGNMASCVMSILAPGRPYGVHVISDCWDTFAPGAFKHPLRPYLRWSLSRRLRNQVRHSSAALYVTSRTLQERYPSNGLMAGISDVDLPDEAFVAEPRSDFKKSGPITLISIGTMATQFTKGHDVLIDAVANLAQRGLDVRAILVGGGHYQGFLEERTRNLGIAERIVFRGQLPAGPRVREELDGADLYVFPTRIEGLPRALVEAMARGLPCISTPVGGIPELLPAEDLVPTSNVAALLEKITTVLANPERLAAMSARNLGVAREFRGEVLRPRWNEFLRSLAEQTAAWNNCHKSPSAAAVTMKKQTEVPVHA
jgi:glycosyltransferase involved in cell wall biosynthesis